jgi:hypothetical protein
MLDDPHTVQRVGSAQAGNVLDRGKELLTLDVASAILTLVRISAFLYGDHVSQLKSCIINCKVYEQ